MFPLNSNDQYIDDNGKRSRLGDVIGSGGGGELPTASPTTKGGIKVGDGLEMDGETMSSKSVPDLLTQELMCGSDADFDYYVPLKKRYKGEYYSGYEIKTISTSSSTAIIAIYGVDYAPSLDEVVASEEIKTLTHNAANTYSDENISVSYLSSGKWRVNLLTTLYDENGDALTSPVEWAYDANVDKFFLLH